MKMRPCERCVSCAPLLSGGAGCGRARALAYMVFDMRAWKGEEHGGGGGARMSGQLPEFHLRELFQSHWPLFPFERQMSDAGGRSGLETPL